MKVTQKLRNKILNAISEASHEILMEQLPQFETMGSPETWNKGEKRLFNLISEMERRIIQNVDTFLIAQRGVLPERSEGSTWS